MKNSLLLISPALCVCAAVFLLFGLDAWSKNASVGVRRAGFWIALIGLVAAACLIPAAHPAEPVIFGRQMLIVDGLSYFLSWIAVLTAFFVLLLSNQCREFAGTRLSAYFGLLLLATVGLLFISMADDLLMVFISIEMIEIPSFILTGYLRERERSNEAAIKFFLMSVFSTAMLVYGISIFYGIAGTTSLAALHSNLGALEAQKGATLLACFLILVSFGFKIGLVPFHMWVPDVFEGAPTPIAAFLSVAPKIAGVAITLRVFGLVLGQADLGMMDVLAVLAAVTMTVGNLIGLRQTNVVRLLAYSSIAQMGYLLLGVVAASPMGFSSAYLYGWVYLFMNLGAFAIVICVSNALGSNELSAYAGLAKRAPLLSGLLVLFLLSLAGIPPTAGFVAKFYLFLAAFQAHWVWLVILAGVNSVISVGYYFKIVRAVFFEKAADSTPLPIDFSIRITLWAASFLTLWIGFGPAGLGPDFFIHKAELLAPPASVEEPLAEALHPLMAKALPPADMSLPAGLPEPSQQ